MPPALTRRRFLGVSAGAAALAGVRPGLFGQATPAAGASSANGDVRIAVVGLRVKGNSHANQLRDVKGARLVAICDADTAIMGETAQRLANENRPVDQIQDFRRLLERKDVDAVIIATPNHLHTLQTIWAVQAGKHVYVEKPVSHTLFESQQLEAAARQYDRVIAAGTQKRSDPGLQEAFAALRAGELGAVKLVRGYCYRIRPPIGWVDAPPEVPATVNLDLFCGPAPLERPLRQRFHYDWHWQWEMGNGELGNQGPHELDLCRLALGETGRPRRVLSLGGRFGPKDNGQTPNTHLTLFDFPTAPLLFEIRGLPRQHGSDAEDAYRGVRVGLVVECEGGSMIGGVGASFFDPDGKRIRRFTGDGGRSHVQNFVDAVRDHAPARLNAPITEATISNDLVHFGNLAYRSGATERPEQIREQLQEVPAAAEAFGALQEHLAANQAGDTASWRLGGWLEWDQARQQFSNGAGHARANALLSRPYREPWVVPDLAAGV